MILSRRQKLRGRMRDLAAASAFAAVLLTGTVHLVAIGTFVVAWALSLFGVHPLRGRRAWATVVLLVAAVGLFGAVWITAMELAIAAVTFAVLVAAHRLMAEPNTSTTNQVLLASLLLLSGGAALADELWYGLCLLLFTAFATLTMGLTVIEGPVERDEPLPVRPVLRQMTVGVAIAAVGAAAFFILFPRLSWNMAARHTPPGLLGGTTGMSDRVKLSGGGSIKTSARVVLKASIDPDPRVDSLERYWVGRSFDVFDGVEWRGSGVHQKPRLVVSLGSADKRMVHQRIELLPAYNASTLVALDRPVSYGNARAQTTSGSRLVLLTEAEGEEVRFALDANAYTYHAYSMPPEVPEAVDLETPPGPQALQLPDRLDPRVAALAVRVGGESGEPLRIARRLESYLKREYAYTLELPGQVDDPLANFLFDRKEGHCEHFATALAVLLRTRNIPARVTAGFFGGERVGDRYLVRAGDAHAWVQAWIDGRGWVSLDATPDDSRRAQPTPILQVLADLYERIEEAWDTQVVDYSIQDQFQFVRRVIRSTRGEPGRADQPGASGPPGKAIAVALFAAALTFFVVRRLGRPGPGRTHPAASFREQLERRLRAAHLATVPGEPLEELSHRLERQGHPQAQAVTRATRRYLEARFGSRPLGKSERRALLDALPPAA